MQNDNLQRRSPRIAVVGSGIAGLVAALELAAKGCAVTVFERGDHLGGKIHQVQFSGAPMDVGPTVLTMGWVFERVFRDVATSIEDHVQLDPLEVLARHAWEDGARLDLFNDVDRSAEGIRAQFGQREAAGFRAFCRYAENIYHHAFGTFIVSPKPSIREMARCAGIQGLSALFNIDPIRRMWSAIGHYFQDPHLQQLFGRYATYYGSSPFLAPGTLNLIAAVELQGCWVPRGGMTALVDAIVALARRHGAQFRTAQHVSELRIHQGKLTGLVLDSGVEFNCDAMVYNGDIASLTSDVLGASPRLGGRAPSKKNRSLSSLTIALEGKTTGFPLSSHNVFFHNQPYREEFSAIFAQDRLPSHPTVYLRAQDRDTGHAASDRERLFMIINAPPCGDRTDFSTEEIKRCTDTAFQLLRHAGLEITNHESTMSVTTPKMFANRFPGTGGALYGQATHSMWAPLKRSGPKTRLPGLFLAGGSVHPGAGVPMAALSGRQAASAILEEYCSTGLSPLTDTPGGT